MIFIGIVTILSIFSAKVISTLKKIKLKYYIITGLIACAIIIYLLYIGINTIAPLELYKNINMDNNAVTRDINEVTPNTSYTFEFDINSEVDFKVDDNYKIQICERNKYDDIIETHEFEFGTYKGTKAIEFITTKYTCKFLLRFESKNKVAQKGLTINNMKINGEDRAVNYKYLPIRLVDKVKDIKFNTISVQGRLSYYKDAIKLIGRYGILGVGADGWKDRRVEVQEYYDYANEAHSYILEVFCEFGIIGFIAIIAIIIYIIKLIIKIIRQKEYDFINNSILIAILAIIIHSSVDFDLSFMYMLIMFFTLIAMVNKNKNTIVNNEKIAMKNDKKITNLDKKKNIITSNEKSTISDKKKGRYNKIDKCMKIIIFAMLIITIYFNSRICINLIKKEENPYSEEILYNHLQIDENFSENIDKIISRRKYTSHAEMIDEIIRKENLTEENYIKLFEVLKSEKELFKNDVYGKIYRIYIYQDIILNINQNKQEYEQEILSEINSTKELLEKPEKCRLSLEEIRQCQERLDDFVDKII